MAAVSPFRTPWTAALLLLVVIWTVWLLGMPASTRSPNLSTSDPLKDTLDKITPSGGRPLSEYGDHKESSVKETISKAVPATKAVTDTVPAGKETSTVVAATSGTAVAATSSTAVTSSLASEATEAATNGTSPSSSSPTDRPLILYSFYETDKALPNLEFFIKHGLHGGADFIFILNGETEAHKLLPQEHSNIKYINRPNHCYDLGAYAEVLTTKDLYKKYKRFILMNASIRGPYVPYWAEGCWSEMYLKKVTETAKLVGMTGNCWPSFHVQSMIWATDIVGLELLLHPPADPSKSKDQQPVGINHCFANWDEAVAGEIGASSVITRAGYKLDVIMAAFHGYDYIGACDPSRNGDVLWDGAYEGTNIHPYDTMFMKTNRNIDPVMVGKMTEWTDGSKYSSWDHCPS